MRGPWALAALLALAACKRPEPVETDTGPTGTPVDTDTDVHTGDTDPPDDRVWVEVSTHPCARDEDGWVECWNLPPTITPRSDDENPIPPAPFRMSTFWAPDASGVVGVHADGSLAGRAELWYCGSTDGRPGSDDPPDHCTPDPSIPVRTLGRVAVLDTQGHIQWWRGWPTQVDTVFPEGETYRLFHGPYMRVAALTHDNRVYADEYINQPESRPPVDDAFDPAMDIVEFSQGALSVCALDSEGSITCLGPEFPEMALDEPVTFSNGPYLKMRAGGYHVCAERASDHVIECNDGSTHAFGPVRDFAVNTEDVFPPGAPPNTPPIFYASPRHGLQICAITTANAVVCEGERYVPEILAQLPSGNGLQPTP